MNNKLNKDPLFVISFWGGLFLGGSLSLLLILNNDLTLCFKVDCFKKFLDFFSLPISAVGGGMALAAFRATIFRSNQTRIQIEETIKQNIFKNFIDHKKEFINVLDMLESAHSIKFTNRTYLYSSIFPENSPVCIKFNSKELDCDRSWLDFQLDKFNELIEKYNEIGGRICVDDRSLSNKEIARWLGDFLLLMATFDITFPESKVVSTKYKGLFSYSDEFNMIPSSISKSVYIVDACFKHLSAFCLPSRGEDIKVHGIKSFYSEFDDKLRVFTTNNA